METLKEIERFLLRGCNFGAGDGSGAGYNSGAGSGCGSGEGSGDDDYGDGSGVQDLSDCYDNISDYDFGYGCGLGIGAGDKNDSGFSIDEFNDIHDYYGIKKFNGKTVSYIDGVATVIERVRGNYALGFIVNDDLTTVRCWIAKNGDYFAHAATIHEASREAFLKRTPWLMLSERIEEFIKLHRILMRVTMTFLSAQHLDRFL